MNPSNSNSPARQQAPQELFDTVNQGRLGDVKAIIDREPKLLHAVRIGGRTALHQAAFGGHAEIVQWLVAQGAEVNAKTDYDWTPLFYATAPRDEKIGLFLLKHGARPDVRNDDGDTPLHFAASYGKTEIVAELLERGADINARNARGETPLDEAVDTAWQPMIDLLRKRGGRRGRDVGD